MHYWIKLKTLFFKIVKITLLVILCILISIFLCIQSNAFQNWATHKVTSFLSTELKTKIEIKNVRISLFNKVNIEGIQIYDLDNKPLLTGNSIELSISNFDLKKQFIQLQHIKLNDVQFNMAQKINGGNFNFDFLINYFSNSKDTIAYTNSNWQVLYGKLLLNNVGFNLKFLYNPQTISNEMNYDNLKISDAYGELSNIKIIDDTIFTSIKKLKAKEACGIELKQFDSEVKISCKELVCDKLFLQTAKSVAIGNLHFKYNQWQDYLDFNNKIYIDGQVIDSTYINMSDIAHFTNALNGYKDVYFANGHFQGTVSNFKVENAKVGFGKLTKFNGNVSCKGIPDMNTTTIEVNCKKLITSSKDVKTFSIPDYNKNQHVPLPAFIDNMGAIEYQGTFFTQLFNLIKINGIIQNKQTTLKLDALINNFTQIDNATYTANIASNIAGLENFNASQIKGLQFNILITGKGFNENFTTFYNGTVEKIETTSMQLKNIFINGSANKNKIESQFKSNDSASVFDLSAKYNHHQNSEIQLNGNIYMLNFDKTKISKTFPLIIATNLNGSMQFDSLKNYKFNLGLNNSFVYSKGIKHKIKHFNINVIKDSVKTRAILNSNIANANLEMSSNIDNTINKIQNYLHNYFPNLINKIQAVNENVKCNLNMTINDFSVIDQFFLNNKFYLAPKTEITSQFNSLEHLFSFNINSDLLKCNHMKLYQCSITKRADSFNIHTTSKKVNITDSIQIIDLDFQLAKPNNDFSFFTKWKLKNNLLKENKINGTFNFNNFYTKIYIENFALQLPQGDWTLNKSDSIKIDSLQSITIKPLSFKSDNQSLLVFGKISKYSTDKLSLIFNNFNLAQFNPILFNNATKFEGTLNGMVSLQQLYQTPVINMNLRVDSLKYNQFLIGNMTSIAVYDTTSHQVNMFGFCKYSNVFTSNHLAFQGYYTTNQPKNTLYYNFKFDSINAAIGNQFISKFSKIESGYLKGVGTVVGELGNPIFNSTLQIVQTKVHLDYTNVKYIANGNLFLNKNKLQIDEITLTDNDNKTASLKGYFDFENAKNLEFNFKVGSKNLLALNTNYLKNTSYYGKAFLAFDANIYGSPSNVNFDIDLTTNKGTQMYIPLGSPSEVSRNNFIKFEIKDSIKNKKQNMSFTNLYVNLKMNVTPDAEVIVSFDRQSGDVITTNGQGLLTMNIDTKGKFKMYGDYIISNGKYVFSLQSVMSKQFNITQGSSIKWDGDVLDANIDIAAIYKQRFSITPIYPADTSKRRYPVESILYIKNKLSDPQLSFGLQFPSLDENVTSVLKTTLSDEAEVKRQVFSILLLGSFITPLSAVSTNGLSAANTAASTGSEMLSNKISKWLQNITTQVEVGLNYRPGMGLNNNQIDLTLNKQLFDNRLSLDGSFGVNNNLAKSTVASNIIGDLNIEYKLSPSGKYRIKGYNKTNDNSQLFNAGGVFSQGIGVMYKEEFNSFSELFKKKTK